MGDEEVGFFDRGKGVAVMPLLATRLEVALGALAFGGWFEVAVRGGRFGAVAAVEREACFEFLDVFLEGQDDLDELIGLLAGQRLELFTRPHGRAIPESVG